MPKVVRTVIDKCKIKDENPVETVSLELPSCCLIALSDGASATEDGSLLHVLSTRRANQTLFVRVEIRASERISDDQALPEDCGAVWMEAEALVVVQEIGIH